MSSSKKTTLTKDAGDDDDTDMIVPSTTSKFSAPALSIRVETPAARKTDGVKVKVEDTKSNASTTPKRKAPSPMSAPVLQVRRASSSSSSSKTTPMSTQSRMMVLSQKIKRENRSQSSTLSLMVSAVHLCLPTSSSSSSSASEITQIPPFVEHPIISSLRKIAFAMPGLAATMDLKESASPELTEKERLKKIRERFDSSFDDLVLVEAGERPSPVNPQLKINTPPCIYGENCGVMTGCLKGFNETKGPRGCVMGTDMTPEAYQLHVTKGVVPDRTACLYCLRSLGQLMSFNVEAMGAGTDLLPRTVIIQTFKNAVDVPGGYKKECCSHPCVKGWNGLAYPIATSKKSYYEAKINPKTGKYYLDQTPLKFAAVISDSTPKSITGKQNF